MRNIDNIPPPGFPGKPQTPVRLTNTNDCNVADLVSDIKRMLLTPSDSHRVTIKTKERDDGTLLTIHISPKEV